MNLYNSTQPNGNRTFSGEIDQTKKGNVLIFDSWNCDDFNKDIPVGINMLLFRNMEGAIGREKTHVNAKYLR
jgi:hypothetical protein